MCPHNELECLSTHSAHCHVFIGIVMFSLPKIDLSISHRRDSLLCICYIIFEYNIIYLREGGYTEKQHETYIICGFNIQSLRTVCCMPLQMCPIFFKNISLSLNI